MADDDFGFPCLAFADPDMQLVPHITSVMKKFHNKLPKDVLKDLAKEAGKTLVKSDYKHKRVTDPTAPISDKAAKKMKQWAAEFFGRAVVKWEARQKHLAQQKLEDGQSGGSIASATNGSDTPAPLGPTSLKDDTPMSETGTSPGSERKRKREDDSADSPVPTPSDLPGAKRLKEDDDERSATPPPPPPPPPTMGMPTPVALPFEEQQARQEAEEALMRENEANAQEQRMRDEAAGFSAEAAGAKGLELGGDAGLVVRNAVASTADGDEGLQQQQQPVPAAAKREVLSH
jgi:histone-lysine N-methyltransferase SETD2